MGKNRKNSFSEEAVMEEEKELLSEEQKPEVMQTVYTHGKVFKIPLSKNVKEFLKEKWPNEKVE